MRRIPRRVSACRRDYGADHNKSPDFSTPSEFLVGTGVSRDQPADADGWTNCPPHRLGRSGTAFQSVASEQKANQVRDEMREWGVVMPSEASSRRRARFLIALSPGSRACAIRARLEGNSNHTSRGLLPAREFARSIGTGGIEIVESDSIHRMCATTVNRQASGKLRSQTYSKFS